MITSGITTEFEKLSHQEKYQAVRDTQIMAQMKEKVIKQHEDPVIILQNARFCSNNSKAVSAFCKIITVATSLFRAPWGKRLFTEFEKLSHQEKYQAVRDTQIMAQIKEKVIKQHDETSKDGAVPVDACVWGNSDQAYDTPHTGRYNL